MSVRGLLSTSIAISVTATLLGAAPPTAGGASSGGQSGGGTTSEPPRPRIILSTPGFADPRDAVVADVLVDRIEFSDGVVATGSNLVLPGNVHGFTYQGGTRQLMLVNGPSATVGRPGASFLADQDLDPNSISLVDHEEFSELVRKAFRNLNLNNRIALQGTSATNLSMIVTFETRLWDSHFAPDQRPELFVFEEQGNSVLRLEALDDNLNPIGTPVEIRAVDTRSLVPSKAWVGRFSASGALLAGAYEMKVVGIDLNQLGVQHLKHLRIRNTISGSGGGETNADFRIMGVDTSPASAAQTICFD